MITSVRSFVLFTVIQVICAEFDEFSPDYPIDPSIPEECYGPPDDINLHHCCPVKPLFPDKELAHCGFKPPDDSRPWSSRDCSPRICIFKKYNLMYENETVNYDEMALFIDKWAENQTNISEGVKQAKTICFGKKAGPPIPQKPFANHYYIPCEVDKLLICVRSNIIWHCDHNLRAPGCKKLANHMDKCRQYLYKEIPTE